ncbi:MAG: cytochrome c oxidase assembly factor 1 family protein [Verrucomicrobiota bacterium]|nr:cytochrome c oxidase assembly factor 1 family protein [Verrucomicrobiota bacterium]
MEPTTPLSSAPPPPPASPHQQTTPRPGWWSRNWKWFLPAGCLTMLIAVGVFVALIVMIVFGAMKSSDSYKYAVARAKADPRVISALGRPIREGWFLSGSTHVSGGSGESDLEIPISGPKGKATIYVSVTKSAGKWSYSKMTVQPASGDDIDLTDGSAEAP